MSDQLPTSATYWLAALVAGMVDLGMAVVLARYIPVIRFKQVGRQVAVVGALFWGLMYGIASDIFWQDCYRYALPEAARRLAPMYGLMLGFLGYGFWWLSRRTGKGAVIAFLALGGLHSLPGHLWAIYGQDLLSRCPLLVQVDPVPALIFGIFEFIFYWGLVLGASGMISRMTAQSRGPS